jgi:uncharacterized membrane protein (DUF106 family)
MDIKKELDEVQKKIDEIKKSQETLKKIADLQEKQTKKWRNDHIVVVTR